MIMSSYELPGNPLSLEIARNELVIMVSIEAKFLINFSREDGIINRTGSSFADSTERADHKSIFQM